MLGLIHDMFRLRFYVNWANFDSDFKQKYEEFTLKGSKRPSLGFGRSIAMVIAAQMFGNLVQLAIPADLLHSRVVTIISMILVPSAIAAAVWYIGSIGETQGPFVPILKAALYTSPIYIFISGQFITTVLCVYYFQSLWSYRARPDHPGSFFYRIIYIATFLLIFLVLCSSVIMFNCTIQGESTQGEVKCRDALRHFFNSPLWKNIVESLRAIRDSLREGGFTQFSETLIVLMDPTGEQHALQVLGLPQSASDDDIRQAYRELSRKFHPDKNSNKNKEELEKTELRFMEVQNAFETLRLRKASPRNIGSELKEDKSVATVKDVV